MIGKTATKKLRSAQSRVAKTSTKTPSSYTRRKQPDMSQRKERPKTVVRK